MHCVVLFQNTLQIRLLAFDQIFSLMIMTVFHEPQLSENTLQCFTPATNEVLIIIKNYPNKTCDLDLFPTLLLKSCINQLIFPITTIINLSMQSEFVPLDLKQALVNPLVKKQTV